jgi:hypothetical protein
MHPVMTINQAPENKERLETKIGLSAQPDRQDRMTVFSSLTARDNPSELTPAMSEP